MTCHWGVRNGFQGMVRLEQNRERTVDANQAGEGVPEIQTEHAQRTELQRGAARGMT